jgi:tetratricopeptide (TPR) repeat protein
MRDPSPRAPFDQGLFLAHFNKGRALYEDKRFAEAEGELEEAYLLRPRDQNVLNLLGLVYFKQDKLDKAEEVYRKLAAESPEVPVLYHNLGLIHFKLGRMEEAESSFLKALELFGENPKINFYLGSIYERLHRFQDAIYQYRQAGANLMVRRVEGKLAASRPPRPRARRPDDTAEFKAREIREAIKRVPEDETLVPRKVLQPVSDSLLALGRPKTPDDTARFHTTELGPGGGTELLGFAPSPPRPAGTERGARATRPTEFRYLENKLMELAVEGKVFIKQGTIYSYGGNLTFWVKDRRPGGHAALVMITGHGKVILTDRDREITFMRVEDSVLHVEPSHLLACEESLTPRYATVGDEVPRLEFLALEGSGMVALSVASKPLALEVTLDLPVSVPAGSVICWTGRLVPHVVEDRHVYEVMLPSASAATLLRLEGEGRILVEQALA